MCVKVVLMKCEIMVICSGSVGMSSVFKKPQAISPEFIDIFYFQS